MDYIEIAAALIGITYLILEYKANLWMWVFGILMAVLFAYKYFSEGVYANGALNIYYIGASVYGLWAWLRSMRRDSSAAGKGGGEVQIVSMPMRYLPVLLAVLAAMTLLIGWVLLRLGESEVVWLDGFTTALNVLGMWMLAKRYYQQWFCWIVLNPIMSVMTFSIGLYAFGVMYVIYTVIALLGFFRWRRHYRQAAQ